MDALVDSFSNREIATLAWLAIGLVWASTYVNIFKLAVPILRISFRRPILSIFSAMVAYVAGIAWLLSQFGMWNATHIKETVIWAVAVGLVAIMDAVRDGDPYRVIGRFLKDAIAVTIFVEFLVGLSSFNLAIELLLVPATAFLGAAYAFYEADEKYKRAATVVSWILALIVLWLVGDAVVQIATNFDGFASAATLADFSLPILLTLLFAPFLVTLAVYTAYETVFSALRFLIPDAALRSHAKLQCAYAFGWNLELLRRWHQEVARVSPNDKQQVLEGIREVLRVWKLEKNPPPVAPAEGWSPFLAKDFLRHPDLVADGYYRQMRGLDDWSATSRSFKLNERYPHNRIEYAIFGTPDAVFRLRITLHIDNTAETDAAIAAFQNLTEQLIVSALGEEASVVLDMRVRDGETVRHPVGEDKEILITLRDLSINDFESSELRLTLQIVGAKLSWENHNRE